MKVMVLVKATAPSEAGSRPPADLYARMGAYNQELIEAGIMQDGGGLQSSSHGARVTLTDGSVEEGPFPASQSIVSGFWIWEVVNMETAIHWAKRCPTSDHGPHELELRPFEGS